MFSLRLFSLSCFRIFQPVPVIRPFFLGYASASTRSTKLKNPILHKYLIESFGFPVTRAVSISDKCSSIKTLERPQSVVHLLKSFGFSDEQIRSSVRNAPLILLANVEKTLKPKLLFFQELGLSSSSMGEFFSKNSTLLTRSLNDRLKPCILTIKRILVNDDDNKDLIRVLSRCNWFVARESESRLISNAEYLKSCGIVGSQLSLLLLRKPRLFAMPQSAIRERVAQILEFGFVMESRMFVHALSTFNSMSKETFSRKYELFKSFGFSDAEYSRMFRRMPVLLRTSEKKLKLGIDFFLNTVKFEKSVLVHQPTCLMFSIKERAMPRYKVLLIIKSKKLLKKEPSFANVLFLPEEEFLEKYISRFVQNAEELLLAYKGYASEE